MAPTADLKTHSGSVRPCGMWFAGKHCCGLSSPALVRDGTHRLLQGRGLWRIKTLRVRVLALGLNGDSTSANKNNGFSKTWHPKIDPTNLPAEFTQGKDVAIEQWFGGVRTPRGKNWQPLSWTNLTQDEILERFAYKYFNWRKDTWDDLTLFMMFNVMLMILAGIVKVTLVDGIDGESKPFALALYEILVVVFGQELPPDNARWVEQVFGIAAITTGLALFALVLALVEQVVLQVLEENVQRGSRVFETGHILVLGWCDTQRDLEMVQKIVQQTCAAFEDEGPNVIVVMTQRDKLFMESYFRRMLPMHERRGMQLVIRQGNPLVPADLKRVSAQAASATILVSDSARSPIEADAEIIRAAILLDELDVGSPHHHARHIVVQVKTMNSLQTLSRVCSRRIMALHTSQINARRAVRMVKYPVVAATSFIIWNFTSNPQVYVGTFPELEGKRFGELLGYFPTCTIYGLIRRRQHKCILNPAADLVVAEGDELVMMRSTVTPVSQLQPLATPVPIDLGGDWEPSAVSLKVRSSEQASQEPPQRKGPPLMHSPSYQREALVRVLETSSFRGDDDEEPDREGENGMGGLLLPRLARNSIIDSWDMGPRPPPQQQTSHLYMLPAESHHEQTVNEPDYVLICGWARGGLHGGAAAGDGSRSGRAAAAF
eukprot:jgi/Botrbrau1/8593/Bobra.0380s0014.1